MLLLVDGSNLLFQMFYGMPSRIVNKDGKAIQGTLGFVGALLKIIKIVEPSHMLVVFDGENTDIRKDLSGEYKSNRIDYSKFAEEDNPFSQLEDVYKALDFMKIKYTESNYYEADDLIASYVFSYGKKEKIIIASWDSDFFQLITEQVKVLRYRGKNTMLCDEACIQQKFGIFPAVYADYKALIGDKADNIKGIPKVGTKTATALIQKYGNIGGILKNVERIEKPSIRNAIIENQEMLQQNYQLIKLENCIELPYDMEELRYTYHNITTNQVLEGIGVR